MNEANYRIIKANGNVKYTGSDDMPSWFTLADARKYCDRSANEKIYEYAHCMQKLWEVL